MHCAQQNNLPHPFWRFIRFYRVLGWVHFLGLPLLGFFFKPTSTSASLWTCLLCASFYLAYAYGINNYFDRRLDGSENLSKNPLGGQNKINLCWPGLAILPAVASIAVSFFLLPNSLPIVLFLIAVGTVYSVPPFRIKTRPLFGHLFNGALFAPLFLLGQVAASGTWNNDAFLPMILFTWPVLLMETLHELEDYKDDLAAGSKTVPVVLGEKRTRLFFLALFFVFLTQALGMFLREFISALVFGLCAGYTVLSIFMCLIYWRRPTHNPGFLRRTMRYVTIAFGILVLLALLTG